MIVPHIIVKLRTGYGHAKKLRVADAVSKAIVTALDCPDFDVSVGIEECVPADWTERVYEPDILGKPETIVKRPGYMPANEGEAPNMNDEPTAARQTFGDIAPALAEITDKVLFGDVWRRPGLSARDRSLITVASLVALYRTHELPFHLVRALENGVTKDELIELITHLAFYSGWPTANSALAIARRAFEESGS